MSEPCFTAELLRFLTELKHNNQREWFQANKARYEREVRDPALRFIEAFAPALAAISPHFEANSKPTGGSLFRIYRDTRFSADKSPYKTHIGVHFRHASGHDVHTPGFYLHLEPGGSLAGIGLWEPEGPALARVRGRIVAASGEWSAIRSEVAAAGLTWMGEGLSRPPKGYDKDHLHIEDLKRKSFAVQRILRDDEVTSPDLLDLFVGACQDAAPLNRFLAGALDLPF